MSLRKAWLSPYIRKWSMQNVEKTKIENPEANMTLKITHAVLLSVTSHNTHESPKGFEKNEGGLLMVTDTLRRACGNTPARSAAADE